MSDLIETLKHHASLLSKQPRGIAWGHSLMMTEAADRIKLLEARVLGEIEICDTLRHRIERLEAALREIADIDPDAPPWEQHSGRHIALEALGTPDTRTFVKGKGWVAALNINAGKS